MKYTIKKGKHGSGFRIPALYWNKKVFEWEVMFDRSAKYDIGVEQLDINKLCGVGYITLAGIFTVLYSHIKGPKIALHHIDSARFGWRYNPAIDRIHLLAYCYVNKRRTQDNVIMTLDFYTVYHLRLQIDFNQYIFSVNDTKAYVPKRHTKKLGYALYPFFGGNKTSPHQIDLSLKKI